ncbi:MAG TPA: hypothetical protein VGO56_21060 [Pyrinomonadaceae bacterium]|jgi:hypothetical protein|nr:hypothetical protein [Pyrinomonadaceae bacterium]
MDPTVLAAITGALAVLSTEVAKGIAGEAGKSAWEKIKVLLGSRPQEGLDSGQNDVAAQLEGNPEITLQVLDLLKSSQSKNVGQLVGSITAEKVVVANDIGIVNM